MSEGVSTLSAFRTVPVITCYILQQHPLIRGELAHTHSNEPALRVQVVGSHQQLQRVLRLDLELGERAVVVRVAQLVVEVLDRLPREARTGGA